MHSFNSHRTALSLIIFLFCMPAASAQCLVERHGPPYLTQYDFFGSSVGLSGNTAAISGRNGLERLVQVYERGPGGWAHAQELTTGAHSGPFTTHMALEGDTIVVGHPDDSGGAGGVSVFDRTAAGFVFTQRLRSSPNRVDSHFGRRLDIDGQQLAVAAPMDDTTNYRGGAVYVFDHVSSGWTQTARIQSPTPRTFGFFGLSIAIEDDLLVVGEPGYEAPGGNLNYVYVYRKIQSVWILEQTLAPAHNIKFGYSVDLDAGRIVVGAYRDNWGGSSDRGSVFAYEYSGGYWQLMETIRANPLSPMPGFGKSVRIKGDRLVVSASSNELSGGNGQVQLLKRTATGWQHEAVIAPPALVGWNVGYGFGAGMAISGEDLWIGAQQESEVGGPDWVGAAYSYTLTQQALSFCGQQITPNSTGNLAHLQATGCGTLAGNNLQLNAYGLPANEFGMFLAAPGQGVTPLGGGSQGILCLSGPVARFHSQAASTEDSGQLSLSIDLGDLPGGITATAGETWNFQAWYRDRNPGPTSNTTDALSVFVR